MADQKASTGHRLRGGLGIAGVRVAVMRRAKAVIALPMLTAALTFAVVLMVPDRFAASVVIQIDPRQTIPGARDAQLSSAHRPFETERRAVEEQIAILRSPTLIDAVVEELHLSSDPEFQERPLLSRLVSPFARADARTVAREAVAERLDISRVHDSSLIRIRFTSRDPGKAQRIANAVAAAYVARNYAKPSTEKFSTGSPKPTVSEKVFASLLSQYGPGRSLSAARVVEHAYMPRHPAGPKRIPIVVAATALSFVLMLAIAVLLQRNALTRTREVLKVLACPHMSSLPAVDIHDDHQRPERSARLIVAEPECRYAEAVRNVCASLTEEASGGGRVILVTSALPGEGAELFASNIAHQLAVAGERSLLLDCDFRARGLTRLLAPRGASGFLDQLAAHAPAEDAILRDGVTGVHFLPASGPGSLSLSIPAVLRSADFSAQFPGLKRRFSTIVLSAPAILPFSDARVLAGLADQIVFLTAWNRTPRELAKMALASLDANQRKVVGAVLTDISGDHDPGIMSFTDIFEEILLASRRSTLDRAA